MISEHTLDHHMHASCLAASLVQRFAEQGMASADKRTLEFGEMPVALAPYRELSFGPIRSRPKSITVGPSKPFPSQLQRRGELVNVGHMSIFFHMI